MMNKRAERRVHTETRARLGRLLLHALVVGIALAVAACGGGSGGIQGTSPATTPPLPGIRN